MSSEESSQPVNNLPAEPVQNDAGIRLIGVEDFEEEKMPPFVDELDNI